MRVKLFTFRYSASLGGFDDRPLVHFIRDKEVLTFREHFFCVNDVPHILCVVSWQEALVSDGGEVSDAHVGRAPRPDRALVSSRQPITPQAPAERRRGAAPDPTLGLDERQRMLFNTLREWRAQQARDDGVPPYLVFTNKHLVELVTTLPDSLTALGNLHGVGPGKVKRYGQRVLKLLGTDREPADQAPAARSSEVSA